MCLYKVGVTVEFISHPKSILWFIIGIFYYLLLVSKELLNACNDVTVTHNYEFEYITSTWVCYGKQEKMHRMYQNISRTG